MPAAARRGATVRCHRRVKAAEDKKKHEDFIKVLMGKYDTSQSGRLEVSELKALLTDLNNGIEPDQSEVDMVLHAVDRRDGDVNDAIDVNELNETLNVWKTYKEHATYINETFDKYDTDNSGALEFPQLKALLQDLNDGNDVSDEDAKHVLSVAEADSKQAKDGKIDKTELVKALAVWFADVQDKGQEVEDSAPSQATEAKSDATAAPPASASSCACIVL